jgi:GntR family transcriptional repressor for pyruvate dehydrogenase complex
LLEVICGFLANVQVAFAMETTSGSIECWREILDGLQNLRGRVVDAIERRDAKAAASLTQEFHVEAMRLITSMPKAQEVRISDPKLGALLSSVVNGMPRRH